MKPIDYRIGYPEAWLGYSHFSKDGPVVNICPKCPGYAECVQICQESKHVVKKMICVKHYQTNTARQLGEQLLAA